MDAAVSNSFPSREFRQAAAEFNLDRATKHRFAEALRRCKSPHEGKRIHSELKSEGYDGYTFLGNLLVQMYGRCAELEDARAAFDRILLKNVYSWTMLMLAYSQNGSYWDVLRVYSAMRRDPQKVKPDDFVISIALGACGSLGPDGLSNGREIHLQVEDEQREGKVVFTGLLDMYSKCGSVEDARKVFESMEQKDVVAWGAIIAAYAGEGDGKSAIQMFRRMEQEGSEPNTYLYSAAIDSCSAVGALTEGREFHNRVINLGLETHHVVATAVVTMYSRCGRMPEARAVFDKVKAKDLVCWNSMLAGYSQQGYTDDALQLFKEIMVSGSWQLDRSTFNSMLHAFSHAGLVEQGRSCFVSMTVDHGVPSDMDHFVHMVDVLGRAGRLEQAAELVQNMPFEPSSVAWVTLLSAFKLHGRVELAELAADRILELDAENTAALVLVSNIYARVGRWDDVRRIRSRGKLSGRSYIEIKNRVHEFGSGRLHPRHERIKAELDRLDHLLREAGYVPDLRDVETMEETADLLGYHSERAALAFGVLSTDAGSSLSIVKNLRVCSECHSAISLISKIVNRTITIRDANCYHRFEQGCCSCKGHW